MTGQTENKNNNNNQGKFTVTSNAGGICSGSSNSGTYPEVTLHPVAGTTNDQAGSLLHGILTKVFFYFNYIYYILFFDFLRLVLLMVQRLKFLVTSPIYLLSY